MQYKCQYNENNIVIYVEVYLICSYGYKQGRSQEETTTEANTRSVVRNQPYEIF